MDEPSRASIFVAAAGRRNGTSARTGRQPIPIDATRRDSTRDFEVKVCLTVDTEFSIGGAFLDPARYRPVGEQRVWCHVGERSHGLGFLLDELDRHDLPATFFVESLHVAYFKNSTMPGIAREIAARGHAVELHAHPCWLTFRDAAWNQAASPQPLTDSFAHIGVEPATRMLKFGLDEIESPGALSGQRY